MPERFTNKVVVVTGAAAGLGRALAIGFAREGAQLVLADRNVEGLHETAAALREAGADSSVHVVDLAVESDIVALAGGITARHEAVDVLVNNAGLAYGEVAYAFEALSQAKWLHFLSVKHGGAAAARTSTARAACRASGCDPQPVFYGKLHAWNCLWRDKGRVERNDIRDGAQLRQRWHKGERDCTRADGNACGTRRAGARTLQAHTGYAASETVWRAGGYCGTRLVSGIRRGAFHHQRDRALRCGPSLPRLARLGWGP